MNNRDVQKWRREWKRIIVYRMKAEIRWWKRMKVPSFKPSAYNAYIMSVKLLVNMLEQQRNFTPISPRLDGRGGGWVISPRRFSIPQSYRFCSSSTIGRVVVDSIIYELNQQPLQSATDWVPAILYIDFFPRGIDIPPPSPTRVSTCVTDQGFPPTHWSLNETGINTQPCVLLRHNLR